MTRKRSSSLALSSARLSFTAALLLSGSQAVWGIASDEELGLVDQLHEPQAQHVDQWDLFFLVEQGLIQEAFELAFTGGAQLWTAVFNALDGAGGNVGDGSRFSRVPRADLAGPEQWRSHIPPRVTGPNGQSCNQCHNQPVDGGASDAVGAHHRDPLRNGILGQFIRRDAVSLLGTGPMQRLAEEMTADLHAIRDQAAQEACEQGISVTGELRTKGVDFGTITVIPVGDPCEAEFDTSGVQGVDANLVIKPLQWKGSVPFIRAFNRGAAHNNLGMQAVEITGDEFDGDFDGVVNELTIGDMTALVIYNAAEPRPTTKLELAELGLIKLSEAEAQAIERGEEVFNNRNVGCSGCHKPSLKLRDATFSEPSQSPFHRDALFPYGPQDPVDPKTVGVDPDFPVTVNLTSDQPDNRILDEYGNLVFHLGALQTDEDGQAIVELYGDLKRHDMGERLAEGIDEGGIPASVFMTENLWGVGSTVPYLHDGRATTLSEAILEHDGEAAAAREAFATMSTHWQEDLIAFLNNLILFKLPADTKDHQDD